jgi:hypothetical protein
VATLEGVLTRTVSTLLYVNRALAGERGVDRNGRVLYGTIAPSGASTPELRSGRRSVIDVLNTNRGHTYALTAQLQRRYLRDLEASVAYTFSSARDVQSLTSSVALSNWRFGRALAGSQLSEALGRSRFDVPHRVVAAATYTTSTRTDLSVVYIGQSGMTYGVGEDVNEFLFQLQFGIGAHGAHPF